MVHLSCTKKVRDKLKKHKRIEEEKVELSINNWYVDLIRLGRKEFYLFTNSVLLYSILVYVGTVKEKKNLEQLFRDKLMEALTADFSVPPPLVEEKFSADDGFQYHKTNSRAILGVMKDFKHQIEVHLWHHRVSEQDYEDLRYPINTCPMSTIGYSSGLKEMIRFLNDRGRGGRR